MSAVSKEEVAALREFNRIYTRRLGVLNEGLLDSPFSLAEVRLMYELYANGPAMPSELAERLDMDRGYLSRLLARIEDQRLLKSQASQADRRSRTISLTRKGRSTFAKLDVKSQAQAAELIAPMDGRGRRRLMSALREMRRALGDDGVSPGPIVLRGHRPGDIGLVTQRHGELYAREYGWDERFEALVAGILSRYIAQFDPARERCWIAERDGEFLGCVFLMHKGADTAQLRMLLVEPSARGIGLGRTLVEQCVGFARRCGYKKIVLWTNSRLDAARHIYAAQGFRLVREEPHEAFGDGSMGQYWELEF
ncbi:helix-turn-helix domain-containing GNAT family N-acetyltransferase [Luteimonas sp. SX5]|uniref:Helix-turn-helix domain-containing GNAT family N-acetyltransferase n=1 Tax=Luteimonas galliterrae TaxID=2940486 RepID=A0ABT0MEW3_9GAMM|nr:helix-turn-helix domain-containing GNAT family N-acetyltransferase [Luteimonas galliterrae]MCL1633417.1 helix-turn-helix domain-containing GNAT family N-acetyltransferase [Luteimonas galliterrae]